MSVEMKNLTIKGTNFEIVDGVARDYIDQTKNLVKELSPDHTYELMQDKATKTEATSYTTINSAGWRTTIEDCAEKDIFIVSGKGGAVGHLIRFYDSSNNILEGGISSTKEYVNEIVIAPSGAAKVVYNDKSGIGSIVKTTNLNIGLENANKALENAKKFNKDHLTILIFGHSFAADSWMYVPMILKSYGITCEIYLYYRGNESIDRLVIEWEETSDNGIDDYGFEHIRRLSHIDTRIKNAWSETVKGYSPKMSLELANDPNSGFDTWDIIVLQTGPHSYLTKAYSKISEDEKDDPRKGYQPWVRKAIQLISESYKKPYTLAWYCVYTKHKPENGDKYDRETGITTKGVYRYVSSEENDNVVDCLRAAESICKAEPIEMVIPGAAAIFNARTNKDLASGKVSLLGNLWYKDQIHLQAGIPCYTASLSIVQSIFDKFYPHLSILNDKTIITNLTVPTKELDEKYGGPIDNFKNNSDHWNCPYWSIHGLILNEEETMAVDSKYRRLAQKAAICACRNPFDITPIYDDYENLDHSSLAANSKYDDLEFYDTKNRYWASSLISHTIISENIGDVSGEA